MNPEEELELLGQLVEELLRGMQDYLQSGTIFSDEFQGAIAQELEATTERIDQLRAQISQTQVSPQTTRAQEPTTQPSQPTPTAPGTQPTGAPSQPPPFPPRNIPELEQAPYPSSNINAFRYDPRTQQLYVRFHGARAADAGPTYLYQGVPQNIFNIIARGAVGPRTSGSNRYHTWHRNILPSHGAAVYALIREGGFPYERVN